MLASILPLNRWLLAVAAALAVALVALEGGGIEERTVEPLFPTFDGARAVRVHVAAPGGGAVTARRAEAGEPWRLEQLFGAEASPRIMDGFLARVGAMSNLDLVSEDPARLAEYELGEDAATRVTVSGQGAPTSSDSSDSAMPEGADGQPAAATEAMADFYVSAASPTAAFVRRAGEARVYRIPSLRVPPATPFTWFGRRALVPYENVQIRRVRAEGSALGGERVLSQSMERFGSFRSASEAEVSGERARDVLQRLRALFPVAVSGQRGPEAFPGEGVELSVTVERVTGGDLRLAFLRDEDGAWLARRSSDRLVLQCDPTVTEGLLEALRALPE